MNDKTILVVDDESQIRRVLRTTLSGNGYDVAEARNGEEAIQVMLQEHPHLILLDVNMPVMNGLDACRKIRLSYAGPVIMLTVRNAELDKVKALDAGADDYVVKPFSMEELLARIRAALRRAAHDEPLPRIETPELTIDLEGRLVDANGVRVHLSPKEFEVLRLLVIHQEKPVTHKKLLQTIWGPDHVDETETLRVVINQLRKKIERDSTHPRYIVTEPWLGYRFQPQGTPPPKRPRGKA